MKQKTCTVGPHTTAVVTTPAVITTKAAITKASATISATTASQSAKSVPNMKNIASKAYKAMTPVTMHGKNPFICKSTKDSN